jgi:carbonic anhydrase
MSRPAGHYRIRSAAYSHNATTSRTKVQYPIDRRLTSLMVASKRPHRFVTILACSDSRVTPEIIFDQGFGDVFVIRVAGNIT